MRWPAMKNALEAKKLVHQGKCLLTSPSLPHHAYLTLLTSHCLPHQGNCLLTKQPLTTGHACVGAKENLCNLSLLCFLVLQATQCNRSM
ncbi:hypothetical protein TIFTF001_041383 [Ficus carica]|uniref:Uncharacterized protein n=1 Tax=Ficus carica TaxID=3494 RepID=A0AA88D879_FICCA|nr:hypothetical protein TIFTF001_041383 [Ficus carica]